VRPGPTVRFVLASASPARLETLRRAGVVPEVIVSYLDEATVTAPDVGQLAQKLAEAKCQAVAAQISGVALVLGCDSLLEFEGEAIGKPGSTPAAVAQWSRMSGKQGVLHTGHYLLDTGRMLASAATAATVVHFADVTAAEIDTYCTSGEPANVAGAFTIDGFGGWFIEAVVGDPHNVVGLSLPTLRRMLAEQGYDLHDLGYPTP